jgi:mannose-1-phosphate guanylyltransferase
MQALVLVGGEGTRLRPLTLTQPKPALPLVDRPFIRFMVDWLAHHGVDEVVMACGFRPDDLRSALGDGVPGGPSIRYLEEEEPLGTAGPVRLAADLGLLGERFMVLNGDVLTDLDLTALQRQHADTGAIVTLALYPVEDPASYGLVRTGPGGEVLEFLEKPDPEQIDTDQINAGAYVVERSAVELIAPGRAVSIEREIFPELVGRGLFGRRLGGYWMDIGTPQRYLQASWDILERAVHTDLPAADGPFIDASATVAPSATVEARAVLRAGCRVGPDARVAESVLFEGCRVGAGALLRGAILAAEVEVGERAEIAPGAVVGRGARIAPGARLAADARVQPERTVEAVTAA